MELPKDGTLTGDAPRTDILSTPYTEWNWRLILFYVGVPAVVAIYAALNNWAVLQVAGYTGSLLFYAGHAFIPWWTTCLVTYLYFRLLSRWRPRQLLILMLGTVSACVIVLPYSVWLTEYFAQGWLPGDETGQLSSFHIHSEIGFWSFTLRASILWIGINIIFDRFLGLPRYRYDKAAIARLDPGGAAGQAEAQIGGGQAVSASPARPAPVFLRRLPADVEEADVIALKAEQHYVKVFTAERNFMTLYRFSDAVAEMDPDAGQQVHRSYWVRTGAIKKIRRKAKKFELELTNEMKVPVSAPNSGLIRQLAQASDIPVYPPF